MSECGKYRLDSEPFIATSHKSDKIFQYAAGTIAAADKIKKLSFNLQEEAKDVHMILGIQDNLLRTYIICLRKYITIFDEEEVNIYDTKKRGELS